MRKNLEGLPGLFMPALAILAVVACLSAGPVRAQGTWHQDEFVVGTWNDPGVGVDSYALAKKAGFNLLTGTIFHSSQNQFEDCCYTQSGAPAILSAAAAAGLKVFLTDGHYTVACCGYTAPAFNAVVPPHVFDLYDGAGPDALTPDQNDALWGYTMWDEPAWNGANHDWLKNWASAMHANDVARNDGHGRAVYLNLSPSCGPTCDYQAAVSDFVNDPDATRQVDVASADLYPFTGPTSNPVITTNYFRPMRQLRAAMGTRPFWVVGYTGCDVCDPLSDPDPNQLRFMAYAPAAAGAKGILWFLYHFESYATEQDQVVSYGGVPTCKYVWLTPINLYLQDVVGPVTLASTHLGIFHQSSAPSGEADLELLANDAAHVSPVGDLGNANFCVGVFRPTAAPSDYYVFIVNKALTAQTGTITLRQSYEVTQSPVAATYAGGNSYTPKGSLASFSLSLLGGEGRMFRLTGAPTPDVALISPVGGDLWPEGQQRTVAWQGNGNPVDLWLYPDTKDIDSDQPGPAIPLATGLVGSSASITMPAGTYTRRARLVLESAASDGIVRGVTNASNFSTAPTPSNPGPSWTFGSSHCYSSSSLALGGDGLPRLGYYNMAYPGTIRFAQYDGAAWSGEEVETSALKRLSTGVTTIVDGLQRTRMAYYNTLFDVTSGEVHHAIRRSNGTWAVSVLDPSVDTRGGLAMAPTPDNEVIVGFTEGLMETNHLMLLKSTTDPITLATTWAQFGPASTFAAPRVVSMAVDANGVLWVACAGGVDPLQTLTVQRVTATAIETKLMMFVSARHVALALDGSGLPRIAFTLDALDGYGDHLYTRTYNGTSWSSVQQVDGTAKSITSLKLVFQSGIPRAIYSANGVVKIASPSGSTWLFQTVDYPNDEDGPVSLAYGEGGARWVSFFDRDLDQVRVIGPSTGGGGGGGCTPTPCRIDAAIALRVENPVARGGAIHMEIESPQATRVNIGLFDVAGRRAASLGARPVPAGTSHLVWRAEGLGPGVYFLVLRADGLPERRAQLVLMR